MQKNILIELIGSAYDTKLCLHSHVEIMNEIIFLLLAGGQPVIDRGFDTDELSLNGRERD